MFPFLAAIIPALIGAAKAVAVGTVTGVATAGAAYGTKKAIEAIAGDDSSKPASDKQPGAVPLKKPATSLEPSWKALENQVPDHLRPPEKPTVENAAAAQSPVRAAALQPEKVPLGVDAANPVMAALPAITQVSTSPLIRL